jgi:hypothetical protein
VGHHAHTEQQERVSIVRQQRPLVTAGGVEIVRSCVIAINDSLRSTVKEPPDSCVQRKVA